MCKPEFLGDFTACKTLIMQVHDESDFFLCNILDAWNYHYHLLLLELKNPFSSFVEPKYKDPQNNPGTLNQNLSWSCVLHLIAWWLERMVFVTNEDSPVSNKEYVRSV
jgi:hypothetical protein